MQTAKYPLDLKGIVSFLLLANGLGWLVVSPLWLSGQGLQHPLVGLILPLLMFTPALATFIVTRWISRPPQGIRTATGLRLGKGYRWGWYWLFAWVGITLMVFASPFVAALFGVYQLDVQTFSGFAANIEQAGGLPAGMSVQMIVLIQLATVLIAPILNGLFTFGEEWGWRGYLLPQLLPLGQWPALLISGVIWGLWHAPVILLGYNYPDHLATGWLMMVAMTTVWGILLGWTRLATGSVWPAVIGHGALNGAAGIVFLLRAEGTTFDSALVGATGVTGWIIPLLFIGVLILTRQLPVRHAPDEARMEAEPAPTVTQVTA